MRLYDAGSFAAAGEGRHGAVSIILVAVDECPEAGTPLAGQFGALRRARFVVVCYGDGVRLWPLGKRCQLPLAGALDVLDSGQAEFPKGLARMLTRLVGAEAHRYVEGEKIRGVMKRLGVVGRSRQMLAVFRWVVRSAALSDLPALVTGETGTGKEVLVNALHRLDEKRCHGPFVALNCGAQRSDTLGRRRRSLSRRGRHPRRRLRELRRRTDARRDDGGGRRVETGCIERLHARAAARAVGRA